MRIVTNIFYQRRLLSRLTKDMKRKVNIFFNNHVTIFCARFGSWHNLLDIRKHTMTVINTSSSTFYILSQTISHTYLKLVWHNRISVTFQIHRRLMKNWFGFTKGEERAAGYLSSCRNGRCSFWELAEQKITNSFSKQTKQEADLCFILVSNLRKNVKCFDLIYGGSHISNCTSRNYNF